MEKDRINQQQDRVPGQGATWSNLNTLFEHMGDRTSANEASNDIHLTNDRDHVALREDHEVHIPSEYLQDSYVGLRSSDLKKARELLLQAHQERPSYKADILLGLATTLLGWFLGELPSSAELTSPLGFLMVCAIVLSAGLLVSFFFIRKNESQSKSDLAERVLEHLADPEDKEPETNEH